MSWLLTFGLTNAALVIPLALLAYLVAHVARRPALAHLVWIAVLLKLVTPPLVPVPVGWEIDPPAWVAQTRAAHTINAAPSPARAGSVSSNEPSTNNRSAPTRRQLQMDAPAAVAVSTTWWTPESLLVALGMMWLLGSGTLLFRAVRQAWKFQQLIDRTGRDDDWLQSRVASVARLAGVSHVPELVVIDGTFSPMLWGVGRRARLVFPGELALRLDRLACDSLLLHELAHYARGDHWVRLLELACQVLFWWHPVVWLARKEIEAAEEQCCDAWVIARQEGPPRDYAEALLTTIDFLNEESPHLPPIASGLGEISLLRRRLTQIMRGDVAAGLPPLAKFLVVAGAVIIAPLAPAVFAASSRSLQQLAQPLIGTSQSIQPSTSETANASNRDSTSESARASAMPRVSLGPTLLRTPPEHWATALSPSGKYKFEAREGLRTTLLDLTTNFKLDLSNHQINCISFSPDERFATGHENDMLVRVWDSGTGGIVHELKGATAAITSVAYSPDGLQVAAGTAGGSVLVWEVATQQLVSQWHKPAAVSCVRWSPDGDRLAVSLVAWNDGENQALVQVLQPSDDRLLEEFQLDRPVSAVAWTGAETLVAVQWNGQGLAWNIASGEVFARVDLGKDLPSAAAWSPDCPLVKAGMADAQMTNDQ